MRWLPAILAPLLLSPLASAQYFNARNGAMGGAGVASSRYVAAPFANPALLTHFKPGDDFGMILPAVGAIVADEQRLRERIDDFHDELDRVGSALDAGTATPEDLQDLSDRLRSLGGRDAIANVGVALAVAVPSKTFAWSVFAHTYLDAHSTVRIDDADVGTILGATTSADLEGLASDGVVVGSAVTEIGLAMASEFTFGGRAISLGVTPKVQRIDTFNYVISIDGFEEEDFDADRYLDDETGFNLDLGAAHALTPQLTLGLMLRNLLRRDIHTVVTGGGRETLSLGPTLTAGAAWSVGWFSAALDLDLTQTERFKGLDDDSQFLRLGLEFDLANWVQLRAGLQEDLEDTVARLYTAGLGISPFDVVHIGLAGMISEGDTYGAIAQLAFTF